MNNKITFIAIILALTLSSCGGLKKPLKPLDAFSSKAHAHKDNIDIFISPLNEFECAELFPGYQPQWLQPAIKPIHITINNNSESTLVFAQNKTNLTTISAEELFNLLKQTPWKVAAVNVLINSIVMAVIIHPSFFLIGINPLAWIQLTGYALFGTGQLRFACGLAAFSSIFPPSLAFFLAHRENNKLYDMLCENSLKSWQILETHGSINGLIYTYASSLPDVLELSLYELGNEQSTIDFALPLTYQGLKQQPSKA